MANLKSESRATQELLSMPLGRPKFLVVGMGGLDGWVGSVWFGLVWVGLG